MIQFLVSVADKKHGKHNFKRGPLEITMRTLNTDWDLSFSNNPHVDVGDKFASEESLKKIKRLQREVTEAKGTIHHSNACSFFNYVVQFESLIGLGHPTTCGYQHVLEDNSITLH